MKLRVHFGCLELFPVKILDQQLPFQAFRPRYALHSLLSTVWFMTNRYQIVTCCTNDRSNTKYSTCFEHKLAVRQYKFVIRLQC